MNLLTLRVARYVGLKDVFVTSVEWCDEISLWGFLIGCVVESRVTMHSSNRLKRTFFKLGKWDERTDGRTAALHNASHFGGEWERSPRVWQA